MVEINKKDLKNIFLDFVKVNTYSDENSKTIPSTKNQVEFIEYLSKKLSNFKNVSNIRIKKDGYLFADVDSNEETNQNNKRIGFISHVDNVSNKDDIIKPLIHENYDSTKNLELDNGVVISPNDYPNLLKHDGHTIFTSSGDTILGSDDKAGVAEIFELINFLNENPDFKHNGFSVAFGPDEEIGIGADNFDVKDFNVDFAFTVDGGSVGELEWETFNAARAIITARGNKIHPGSAKGVLINPIEELFSIHEMIPKNEKPETTEGTEGFFYLEDIKGDADVAVSRYLIRDHDSQKFQEKKEKLINFVKNVDKKNSIDIKIDDQYYNMGEIIKNDFSVIEIAEKAFKNLKINPIVKPVRGGTDGSKISYLGIPTPNIFTGGENMHSNLEYVSLENMTLTTNVLIEIVKLFSK